MYILIVASGYSDNRTPLLGIFEFDQAKSLNQTGHKVVYISLDLRSIRRRRRLGKYWLRKDGIDILNISIPLGNIPKQINYFIGRQVLKLISQEVLKAHGSPDIIHAHFSDIGFMASVLKEKFKVPLVITEHSSLINTAHLTQKQKRNAYNAYSKADKLITVSAALRNMIFKHFNIESEIVHNIVDVNEFNFVEKRKTNLFTFISVGNLNHNKGFDILINAFKKAEFDESVQLKIIGQGREFNRLQYELHTKGLFNQVQLLGFMNRNEISKLMQESDAFVLASRSETFGVVYIEALLTGLPVIATLCGGPQDFVDSENGLLVAVDDVNALATALQIMNKSIDKYNRKAISKKCRQRFSPNEIANELVNVYRQVLHEVHSARDGLNELYS